LLPKFIRDMKLLGIPLPWLQLTHEKSRLLIALAGVAFANLLLFIQLGLRDSLYDTAIQIHRHFRADLVLVNPGVNNLIDINYPSQGIPLRRLDQARAFAGVESVSPLYSAFVVWKNPETQRSRPLIVFGFEPDKPAFDLPEVTQQLNKLKLSDIVLFDRASRFEFGPVATEFQRGRRITTEVNNRRVKVGGLFTLGGSIFSADGLLMTSELNFRRITARPLNKLSLGLIKLEPGVDAQKVRANLAANLPSGVSVLTLEDFINLEKQYWQDSSSIGYIFTLGAFLGFIIGSVIVYQVLYSDVSTHLGEYATLKAIGYTNTYLLGIVFQEALLLSILGYIPGFFLSLGGYYLIAQSARLPIVMELGRAILVFFLTVLMCFLAGVLAVRKLRDADPADIYS
jgi:putative ABC transport system permease protein